MKTKEQVLNWVDYMLKSNPCMNVEDRNMFNAIKYYITEKQTDGDLISLDFIKKLGATCIAKRSETGELVAISSMDNLPSAEKTDGDLITEIDKLPRIKVGNSNSPTVKYCIDEVLLYDLLEHYKESGEEE